jgi:hypothetical protein
VPHRPALPPTSSSPAPRSPAARPPVAGTGLRPPEADAARAALAAALTGVAARLDALAHARAGAARAARHQWHGPHRTRFDAERATRDAAAAALGGRCRTLAAALR